MTFPVNPLGNQSIVVVVFFVSEVCVIPLYIPQKKDLNNQYFDHFKMNKKPTARMIDPPALLQSIILLSSFIKGFIKIPTFFSVPLS